MHVSKYAQFEIAEFCLIFDKTICDILRQMCTKKRKQILSLRYCNIVLNGLQYNIFQINFHHL